RLAHGAERLDEAQLGPFELAGRMLGRRLLDGEDVVGAGRADGEVLLGARGAVPFEREEDLGGAEARGPDSETRGVAAASAPESAVLEHRLEVADLPQTDPAGFALGEVE